MPGIAVLGAQWGDEGKGKVSHLVSRDADKAVRFNGGTNAGHTVAFAGANPHSGGPGAAGQEEEFKFHLIPSGALHAGCTGVLGNGMVIEPLSLAEELDRLAKARQGRPRIYVSQNAHLILPYHPIVEKLEGSKSEIDTTAKGIGPAYQDKAARRGLRAQDLRDPDRFIAKFGRNLEHLRALYPDSGELRRLRPEPAAEQILQAAEAFREELVDTAALVNEALDREERVVFEGAQGCLLDIDFGTYPYVTSSHATVGGIGVGAGVSPRRVARVIGVVKAFTSRVGAGPFPTEERGPVGEKLRGTGAQPWDEFGTTTGRPRRCGWLDLVALRYAARLNGFTELALIKLDVLSGLEELKVATAYRCRDGVIHDFPPDGEVLGQCQPIYQTLPGWREDLQAFRSWEELPENARSYVRFLEDALCIPVSLVSVGRSFEETIWRPP